MDDFKLAESHSVGKSSPNRKSARLSSSKKSRKSVDSAKEVAAALVEVVNYEYPEFAGEEVCGEDVLPVLPPKRLSGHILNDVCSSIITEYMNDAFAILSERYYFGVQKCSRLVSELRDAWLHVADMQWLDDGDLQDISWITASNKPPEPISADTWAKGALELFPSENRESFRDPEILSTLQGEVVLPDEANEKLESQTAAENNADVSEKVVSNTTTLVENTVKAEPKVETEKSKVDGSAFEKADVVERSENIGGKSNDEDLSVLYFERPSVFSKVSHAELEPNLTHPPAVPFKWINELPSVEAQDIVCSKPEVVLDLTQADGHESEMHDDMSVKFSEKERSNCMDAENKIKSQTKSLENLLDSKSSTLKTDDKSNFKSKNTEIQNPLMEVNSQLTTFLLEKLQESSRIRKGPKAKANKPKNSNNLIENQVTALNDKNPQINGNRNRNRIYQRSSRNQASHVLEANYQQHYNDSLVKSFEKHQDLRLLKTQRAGYQGNSNDAISNPVPEKAVATNLV